MQELDAAVRQLISRVISRYTRRSSLVGPRINLVGTTKKRTHTRGRAKCPASFSLAGQVVQHGCAWPSRRPGSKAASSKAVQGTALQNAAVRSGAPSLSHLRLARGSKRACRPWPRGARILPSFNFLEKKAKRLVSGEIPEFSRCTRSRKRIYPGG